MQKPATPRLSTDPTMDYDIGDRVARELQDSDLHIFRVGLMMGLPKPLQTGTEQDELCSLVIHPTLLTDGHRGWLILVEDTDEWDVEEEISELFGSMIPAHQFVVRACELHRPPKGSAVPLRECDRVRSILEEEYERAFAGKAPIDHDTLLEACKAYRWSVEDERALRAAA